LALVGVVESSMRVEESGCEVALGRGVVGGVASRLWLRFAAGRGSICICG
jgi:hypothetical protein